MDGVFVLNGTLDAEGGAILRAALAAVEGKPQAGDRRTAPQRRADAMVDLGRHRLDAGDLPTSGCQRPHLTVTADLEVLAGKAPGAGLLNWEQLVPAETVRRQLGKLGLRDRTQAVVIAYESGLVVPGV